MDDNLLRLQKEAFLSLYTPPANAKTPRDIALASAIVSVVRRNPTYSKNLTRTQKKEIVAFWRGELIQRGKKYLHSAQTINTYIDDVISMRDSINAHYGEFLQNAVSKGIRIAHCPKSLSIYLKYMWCQNVSTVEPPLCPIDRVVLSHCDKIGVSWTRIDDVDTLQSIISLVSRCPQHLTCCNSVAEWELRIFNL